MESLEQKIDKIAREIIRQAKLKDHFQINLMYDLAESFGISAEVIENKIDLLTKNPS